MMEILNMWEIVSLWMKATELPTPNASVVLVTYSIKWRRGDSLQQVCRKVSKPASTFVEVATAQLRRQNLRNAEATNPS
jgi:hypothetical protein